MEGWFGDVKLIQTIPQLDSQAVNSWKLWAQHPKRFQSLFNNRICAVNLCNASCHYASLRGYRPKCFATREAGEPLDSLSVARKSLKGIAAKPNQISLLFSGLGLKPKSCNSSI